MAGQTRGRSRAGEQRSARPSFARFSSFAWPAPRHRRRWNTLLWLTLFLMGMGTSVMLVGHLAYERALRQQADEARSLLSQRGQVIERYVDRYRVMPAVLALDPLLLDLLAHPHDRLRRQRANKRLEQINQANRTGTLTLIDRDGIGLAASNWNDARSNIGHSYAFRPYFRDAMTKGDGEFYGIGMNTRVGGYFIARALYDQQRRAVGAISAKVEMEDLLEAGWSQGEDRVLLSDGNGIVFLTDRAAWRYRRLSKLTDVQQQYLASTRQYHGQALRTARIGSRYPVAPDTTLTRIVEPGERGPLLWRQLRLPRENWTLHLLRDPAPSARTAWVWRALAAGGWLLLGALALLILQRNRMVSIQVRNRQELEKMVEHHAAALRSAHDGVLDAVRQAALAGGGSLDHLPHGISVIDDQLKLKAWNQRYAELFHYPAELLQVGRPIEDLIRYNAKRGLLGDSEPMQAVRKRVEHLQRSQPYVHERERADGTVIEIRGNPLPGGGFVTSYADITAYKQAARDLRTLADSLEQGIAQRTRDLQAAKAEAERANLSKTRFVAAAVHDLLQPVNAARMYLASLRKRCNAENHPLIDHVDDALDAQDGILSSLLDIARLESGALKVHRSAFPLTRMFAAIGSQFRLLAASRGVRLHCTSTTVLVDSDEVLLRRIVQNLVANALQFTPRGGAVVLCCRRAVAGVRIEIRDNGPGIAQEHQQSIFEEFKRLDHGIAAAEEGARGAGLGLAIVQRIARLLQHRLALRSRSGQGSVFSVQVPCAPVDIGGMDESLSTSASPAPCTAIDPLLNGKLAWVVDDDAAACAYAATVLTSWGVTVITASNGTQALLQAQEMPIPELLLVDYHLGQTDGHTLAQRLGLEWQAAPATIVMSADTDPHLRQRGSALGWEFLPKPLQPAELHALILRLIASRRG